MAELENFDHTQVMVRERENQRLKSDLERCTDVLSTTSPAPTLSPGTYKLVYHYFVATAKALTYYTYIFALFLFFSPLWSGSYRQCGGT